MRVPVHVIGGFLGAGKTTAIVHLLDGPLRDARVGVVVNDFGEGAIDEARVGARAVTVREIRGRCACCTAPEGFSAAVAGLLDEGVERILVEPTGLARPADLLDTLRRAPYAHRLDLRPLVVLVDPEQLDGPHHGRITEQALAADHLVASRVELARDAALARFDDWAAGLWPGPLSVRRARGGAVDPEVLAWPDSAGPRTAPSGATRFEPQVGIAVHGHAVQTLRWPPDAIFHRGRLLAALASIRQDAAVTRVKGLFRTDEGWTRLEIAGGRQHEGPTAWRRDSRVDLIVVAGATWTDEAHEALSAALLTADERQAAAHAVEVSLPGGRVRRFDRAALAALPDGVDDVAALVPGRQGAAARVGALFDVVGVPAGRLAVVVAADGYTTPPVPADALRPGLLVHSAGGGPLPAEQGGPIRLLIPGDAGPGGPCANVKGVVRIAVREP